MILKILNLYAAINIFLLGAFYEAELRTELRKQPALVTCLAMLCLMFGALVVMYEALILPALNFLNDRLQIVFFWKFYVKNGWRNLDDEAINEVKRRYYTAQNRFKGFQKYMYLKCCKMVFKRNNRILK